MNVVVHAIPVFVVPMAAELAAGERAGRALDRLDDAIGLSGAGADRLFILPRERVDG